MRVCSCGPRRLNASLPPSACSHTALHPPPTTVSPAHTLSTPVLHNIVTQMLKQVRHALARNSAAG